MWASRFVFLGAVWRAFKPGTKLDETPILIGPQGIGKSTAIRLCLPPEYPFWFTDGLHLGADPKTRAEAVQGRVIVEASEMTGVTRAELESLKTFLAATDDGAVRFAYDRYTEPRPRRWVMVGTTNAPECLPNDLGGNRRFVPLELKGGSPGKIEPYFDEHREQLWAEAVALYHAGEQAWLPYSLQSAQRAATEQHRQQDELIENSVAGLPSDRPLTLDEILEKSRRDPTKTSMAERHAFGAALLKEGWSKKRRMVKGDQLTLWTPAR